MVYFSAKVFKMKVFSIISCLFFALTATANAQLKQPVVEAYPTGLGTMRQITTVPAREFGTVEQIAKRDLVRCGTNLRVNSYAYKERNVWYGIDVDLCRVIAQAITGDKDKFEMVHVPSGELKSMLDAGKVDVVLSGASYSAKMETTRQVLPVGFIYFDHQFVLARKGEPTDLGAYRNKKICLSKDSNYVRNFNDYNTKYNLGINTLTFKNVEEATSAFMLNRCDLLTANGLILHGLLRNQPRLQAEILPTQIAVQPVYAVVQRDNVDLQIALKWIFNALLLAEDYGITTQNLGFFATNEEPELRYLLGDDPQLWQDMHIRPKWLREVIADIGNYADIYDRNIGKKSDFKLRRGEGRLMKNGGTMYPQPFI